jgi:hypothetical protein
LWEYKEKSWARKLFEHWRTSLKWQRLKPYEGFAEMIESRWDGLTAFIRSEDKISLGLVEGLNNKSESSAAVPIKEFRAYFQSVVKITIVSHSIDPAIFGPYQPQVELF